LWLETLNEIVELAGASQNCFDKVFAVAHEKKMFEIDLDAPARIIAQGNPVHRAGEPAGAKGRRGRAGRGQAQHDDDDDAH